MKACSNENRRKWGTEKRGGKKSRQKKMNKRLNQMFPLNGCEFTMATIRKYTQPISVISCARSWKWFNASREKSDGEMGRE